MPLFHFNLADHVREPDIEGTELCDIAAARVEAIVFAGEYLRDNPAIINDGRDFRVEVTDDGGMPLFTVRLEMIEEQGLVVHH